MEVLKLLLLLALSCTFCMAEPVRQSNRRKMYVCPPKFQRLSHRCYFFGRTKKNWNDAHFACRDMRSRLAIVRNKFQNKLLTRMLNKSRDRLDHWLGAKYDWNTKQWIWADSGNRLTYDNFHTHNFTQDLTWNCAYMDSSNAYQWNAASCFAEKHFICHRKIKMATDRERKKLQQQYDSKLNEIPVPGTDNSNATMKEQDEFAFKAKGQKRRFVGGGRRKGFRMTEVRYRNGTTSLSFDQEPENAVFDTRRSRRKNADEVLVTDKERKKIRWKSYYKDPVRPYYPRPNVQEYTFSKE